MFVTQSARLETAVARDHYCLSECHFNSQLKHQECRRLQMWPEQFERRGERMGVGRGRGGGVLGNATVIVPDTPPLQAAEGSRIGLTNS